MDAKKSRSLFAAGQPVGARHRRRLGLLPRHGRVLRPTRPPQPDKLQATYEFADPAPILAWTIGLALHRHSSPSHLVGGVGGDCGKKPGWKAERADPESMEAKSASGADERSKSISVAEEARIIKKHLLAALIKHAFNFFFVVVLAGYIICMYGALKYYPLLYAIMGIAFMSPYFVTMLKMLPLLKGFYIERYATDPVMPM